MEDSIPLSPERRAALVTATVTEFARAGYDGASLNRIIRDAGMSKSSFYHFVGSKEGLFEAVVRMLIADVRARWTPPEPSDFGGRAFWRRVDALLAEVANLSATPAMQHLGRIFYLGGATAGEGARSELLRRVRVWVEDVLHTGRASGAVRADLPLELQADIVFSVLRAVDEWVLRDGEGARGRSQIAASAPSTVLHRLLGP